METSDATKGAAMNGTNRNPYAAELAEGEGTLGALACAVVMAVLCIGMIWVLSRLS